MIACKNCGTEFVVVIQQPDPSKCSYCGGRLSSLPPFTCIGPKNGKSGDHLPTPTNSGFSLVCPKCQPEYPGVRKAMAALGEE